MLVSGLKLPGELMIAARTADCSRVSSEADTPKYASAAVSTPYAPRPK